MPKIAKTLTAIAVRSLLGKPGRWPVGGAPGLLLQVGDRGAASWLLRVSANGRRRDIGLGSYRVVDLATARDLAREKHADLKQGRDPVAERREQRAERASQGNRMTFDEAAKLCHAAKSAEFKNEKFKNDWLSAVTRYASPTLGKLPVADIGVEHIVDVLSPIWTTKTETASRLRGRIETILDWATVSKHREGENPARWKGNLSHLLANPKRLYKTKHRRAVPWQDMPSFMTALRKRKGMGAAALEFAILTAARSIEVREATWDEIDLNGKLWIVPAERMKAGKTHRQPLSSAAIDVLKKVPKAEGTELVFPSTKSTPLSDMALLQVMRKLKSNGTPHGTARSSFKDWCRNCTTHADEVSELALAHVSTDSTRAAYARDELLAQRALLMREWSDYLGGTTARSASKKRRRKGRL